MKNITIVIVLVFLLFSSLTVSATGFSNHSAGTNQPGQSVKTLKSVNGIVFTIWFDERTSIIRVKGANTGGQEVKNSGIIISVDDQRLYETMMDFSANETWIYETDFGQGLDTLETQHTVTVSTFGNYTQFNFTRKINASATNIPKPYISNVEIQNGTIDGKPSAVAKVTVVNPSIQTYPTKLMVHTTGTDGSFYAPSVAPGETETITVELLDERGAKIAGEARLYAGNFSKGNGAMDQVEFVGQAGGGTDHWNQTYEPVKGPWDEHSYSYENESVEPPTLAEKLSGGRTLAGVPIVYVAAACLLPGLVLFRKLR